MDKTHRVNPGTIIGGVLGGIALIGVITMANVRLKRAYNARNTPPNNENIENGVRNNVEEGEDESLDEAQLVREESFYTKTPPTASLAYYAHEMHGFFAGDVHREEDIADADSEEIELQERGTHPHGRIVAKHAPSKDSQSRTSSFHPPGFDVQRRQPTSVSPASVKRHHSRPSSALNVASSSNYLLSSQNNGNHHTDPPTQSSLLPPNETPTRPMIRSDMNEEDDSKYKLTRARSNFPIRRVHQLDDPILPRSQAILGHPSSNPSVESTRAHGAATVRTG